jgi:Flp pilus assembly pilin Flp
MNRICLRLCFASHVLLQAVKEEHGQDLVEYAAVISLVVLGITAGMTTLANGINTAMTSVAGLINTTIG